jgi:hypothetical protein
VKSEWLLSRTEAKTNVDEDMEKKEPVYVVDENIN